MSARRLVFVAAALAVGVSELALWLQLRDALHSQADMRGELSDHRCSPAQLIAPVSTPLFSAEPPTFERLVGPAPVTDPALEKSRG